MFAVPAALIVLALIAAGARLWPIVTTALLLTANWGACALISYLSGSVSDWIALAGVDYVTAVVLALMSARRPQFLIVALYAGMLVLHVAYSVHEIWKVGLSEREYFDALTVLAWLQIASVGGWLGVDAHKARRSRRHTQSGAYADSILPRQTGGDA